MRALILSDIHGSLEALEAVFAAADRIGDFDAVWDLGDVVGYGGSPNQVCDLVRERATMHVRGNHDRVCCGLSSALSFNPVARQAAAWTEHALNATNCQWLRELPQGPLTCEPFSAVISHGSPTNEDLYILNIRDAWAPLQQMERRTTFFGHTHVQGGFSWMAENWKEFRPRYEPSQGPAEWVMPLEPGRRYLINPGSVGQPRDGDWRAAFAVLDEDAATVAFHRVPYDLARAQGRILMADLPERLALRLREGR